MVQDSLKGLKGYRQRAYFTSKKAAIKEAKLFRKEGYRAKVVGMSFYETPGKKKRSDTGNWDVYVKA